MLTLNKPHGPREEAKFIHFLGASLAKLQRCNSRQKYKRQSFHRCLHTGVAFHLLNSCQPYSAEGHWSPTGWGKKLAVLDSRWVWVTIAGTIKRGRDNG